MDKRLYGRYNEDASERQSCLASICAEAGGSKGVCLRGRESLRVRLRRLSPASLLTAALQCLLPGGHFHLSMPQQLDLKLLKVNPHPSSSHQCLL